MMITTKMMAENAQSVKAMLIDKFADLTADEYRLALKTEAETQNREEIINTINRCITRKCFVKRPEVKPPANIPLWHIFHDFFKSYFLRKRSVPYLLYKNAEDLAMAFQDRYLVKYEVAEVKKMMDVGFEFIPEHGYKILRSDYIIAEQEAASV
jgi:hypothetical protein